LLASFVWSVPSALIAQSTNERPSNSLPVSEISWDYFCDPAHKVELTDRLKCIQLNPDARLSLSGELRLRGEYFDHIVLGSASPSSGYLLQRYLLSTDLTVGDRFRFFSTLESGFENGRAGGPRPAVDEDRLFVHQGFLQFRSRVDRPAFDLRVGRQDLSFGAGRLIGKRELPNVQQNFDGVLLNLAAGTWQTSVLAFRPSINAIGVFDDAPDHASSLWGVYATDKQTSNTTLDLYYLGFDRKSATFQGATGREQRETLGIRYAGERRSLDHDSEFAYQFGSLANRSIQAWTVTTYTGFTMRSKQNGTAFRVAIDTGIASGNHNPDRGTFGTFNALFPRGAYFGYANFIGPYNVQVIRPSFRITSPASRLVVWPNVEWLWRQSKQDGVYSIPAVLVRPGFSNDARYIGFQTDVNITWRQNAHIIWNLDGEHLFAGAFLHQTTAGKSVNYIAPGVSYQF
jgi:hypothetical protein